MYMAIDMKSFYASVECVERGLNPLTTNLVVADESRTEKTICLAVTPSLKAYGISGRARLFEVVQRVKEINRERKRKTNYYGLEGESCDAILLEKCPELKLSFLIAPPRMALYEAYSTSIYRIYLRYFAPEDIHAYSCDEVFIRLSGYPKLYRCTEQELAMRVIREILRETGITATAGIGTNLYLAKVAMDIVAKKMPPDKNSVRIAELDELEYRKQLWEHTPLTDFWRVGKGIAKKLEANRMHTMGDIALCSEYNEDKLFRLFGKNAELLIDHAWGYEPCIMAAIKSYRTQNHSVSSGQVLSQPYTWEKARLVLHEMADQLSLELTEKRAVCDQIHVAIAYDHTSNLSDYNGKIVKDRYGKSVPKPVNGLQNLEQQTASTRKMVEAALEIYDRIVDRKLLIRRLTITANHAIPEEQAEMEIFPQYSLFDDVETLEQQREQEEKHLQKEHQIQQTMTAIKQRYGKNAIVKAMNFMEGATAIERNGQIGGHRE